MERHWERVTKNLSKSTAQQISYIVSSYENEPGVENAKRIEQLTRQKLDMHLSIKMNAELPPAAKKPFFSILDLKLSQQVGKRVKRPYWIDTTGKSNYVDIRIKSKDDVFLFIIKKERVYASSTHIFLMWMVGSSIVLLIIAIIFLRNQIRPILQLAHAAQSFGVGRDVPDFQPRGAAEIKAAAEAFIKMRERIERHVDQRTAMLAGVSHDLRTILTRFKLNLAVLGDSPEVEGLKQDTEEMQNMLEDYMSFAKGDEGEKPQHIDIPKLFRNIRKAISRGGKPVELALDEAPETADVKPNAIRRCIGNLVTNACRHADWVRITVTADEENLHVYVDDDGPGIPEEFREDVFRPFFRIDNESRNHADGGTGLGLAIAKDIARSHGGDLSLEDAEMGGLRAHLSIPLFQYQ
jgi:two-component system osmolarity sensor histidine kinase EnvZ